MSAGGGREGAQNADSGREEAQSAETDDDHEPRAEITGRIAPGGAWSWPRPAVFVLAGVLAVAVLVGTTAVALAVTAQGASRDPATSLEHFLHHIGHRDYDKACAMAVSLTDETERPLREGSRRYRECFSSMLWLGSDHWRRTDVANARDARVTRVDRDEVATVSSADIVPRLPSVRTTRLGDPPDLEAEDAYMLSEIDGKWYPLWPPLPGNYLP